MKLIFDAAALDKDIDTSKIIPGDRKVDTFENVQTTLSCLLYTSYHTDLYVLSTEDGSVISTENFDVLDENSYIQYMLTDGEGLIYLITDQSIEVISTQGEKKTSIDLSGNWVNSAFTAGGKIYVCMWGGEGFEIYPVDSTIKTIGSPIKSDSLNKNYGLNFYENDGTQVLVSDGTTVYSYDPAEDKSEALFDWLDADINSDDVQDIGKLSDGRYYVLTRAYSGDSSYDASYSLVLLTKTPASEAVSYTHLYSTDRCGSRNQ